MAISKKIMDNFNAQINREYFSSYLYLAMAGYFETANLKGFANWMRVQAEEEKLHAMKFYDFILERGGEIELEALEKPPKSWDSPLVAFQEALKHEEFITGHIHNLADISLEEKDHAAHSFLKWFVDEQVEEEDTANEIIGKLKLVGDSGGGLFMLDAELNQRPMVTPTPADSAGA